MHDDEMRHGRTIQRAGTIEQDGAAPQNDTVPVGADPCVWREVTIEATPAEVWELLDSEAGRRQWLEPEAERTIEVIESQPPTRLVWRWQTADEREHRVEIIAVPEDDRTRVIVIESAPSRQPVATSLSLSMLASAAASLHATRSSRGWTLALA